ncbi:MAG: Zn-dependent protease [Candidatus Marinimicrobia bacterium]|nr:Zn-dependent protease [Candidatus Neomarinimicrobiota bacterium]|tara:strand:- start:1980 stop:3395 length:1416 start_codon:yes stop_codon:yes gene_type:complete
MNLKKALENINIQADWIGLREVKESTTYRIIRDLNPESNNTVLDHGIMVEVLVNGQFGYFATNNMSYDAINQAAKNAYTQALNASKYSLYPFTKSVRPKSVGKYQSPYQKKNIPLDELMETLINSNKVLRGSKKIVSAISMARIVDMEMNFISTNGSEFSQNFMYVGPGFRAIAQDGNIVQSRSYTDQCMQAGMEVFEQERVLSKCETICKDAVELLSADECPTEKMDLVLHSDQMLLQIHESIGHALEVDRILGDERNYAGWSFVNLEDFGKLKYGSDIMNITFDPTIPEEFASYGFDDSGLKATKEFIIKDGVLLRGLGGLESQERSNIDGVANFRACSWNRAPIDRMANLNLEPGDSSFDEIISSVEKGIYMQTNRSWSIDDFRNKFQFGCEYAQLIENGQITKTVKNPNYRAVSTPFWNSLKMVGNQDTFDVYGTPYCGKGEPNQGVRVGHASPTCLFNNIEIFGGA